MCAAAVAVAAAAAAVQILKLITEYKMRPTPDQKAVYVSSIPEPLRNDQGLRSYFDATHPNSVTGCVGARSLGPPPCPHAHRSALMGRDYSNLEKEFKAFNNARSERSRAEAKMEQARQRAHFCGRSPLTVERGQNIKKAQAKNRQAQPRDARPRHRVFAPGSKASARLPAASWRCHRHCR